MNPPIIRGLSEKLGLDKAAALKDLRSPQTRMAASLAYFGRVGEKHVYAGTVPEDEVQRRRAKNRAARRARKVNRQRGRRWTPC